MRIRETGYRIGPIGDGVYCSCGVWCEEQCVDGQGLYLHVCPVCEVAYDVPQVELDARRESYHLRQRQEYHARRYARRRAELKAKHAHRRMLRGIEARRDERRRTGWW
jgi:hypothetical protein